MPSLDSETLIDALALEPEKAIAFLRAKGFAITFDWRELLASAHRTAFTSSRVARMDVLMDIRSMVDSAIKEGVPFRDFLDDLEPRLRAKGWWGRIPVRRPSGDVVTTLINPWRLETIYRTNLQSAYMAGRWQEQWEDREERPYLQYIAVLDGSTRPSHARMSGVIRRIDDPFWDVWHPPNGYNCRCRTRALRADQVEGRGGVTADLPSLQPDNGFHTNPGRGGGFLPPPGKHDPDLRAVAIEEGARI